MFQFAVYSIRIKYHRAARYQARQYEIFQTPRQAKKIYKVYCVVQIKDRIKFACQQPEETSASPCIFAEDMVVAASCDLAGI